ncbi:MAG: V-type ATPase subunit [Firmicutes bacterium]|nr:V-type ATPase subunit [Bacillota bacterium]
MAVKYVNVNTKIRGMYAKVFKDEDYEELLRQNSEYASLILLKSKEEYEKYLKDLDSNIHRGELEKILQQSLIKDIQQISLLLDQKGKRYFKVLESKYIDEDAAYNNKLLYLYTKKYLRSDKDVLELIGTKIDVLNILSIYRAKKYYNLSKDKTMDKLIKVNYKIPKEIITKLCDQSNAMDLFKILEETKYGQIFISDNEEQMEKNAKQYLYRTYKKHLRQDLHKFSNILAYVFLREIEIENIINIIEGTRYGQDMAVTRNRIVM